MNSHRDRIVALFEKHRMKPGTPFDEVSFLGFLLAKPKKKRAVYDSFRGLRRFNAFIDEVQYEFAICFSQKDREANYSLDDFVDRIIQLEQSRRSSLASLNNQMKSGYGWSAMVVTDFFPLIAAISLRGSALAVAVFLGIAIALNVWFFRFMTRAKRYHERLLTKIRDREQRVIGDVQESSGTYHD
jgi:hypothetical protein